MTTTSARGLWTIIALRDLDQYPAGKVICRASDYDDILKAWTKYDKKYRIGSISKPRWNLD